MAIVFHIDSVDGGDIAFHCNVVSSFPSGFTGDLCRISNGNTILANSHLRSELLGHE